MAPAYGRPRGGSSSTSPEAVIGGKDDGTQRTSNTQKTGAGMENPFSRESSSPPPSSLLTCLAPVLWIPSSVQRERVQRIVHCDEHVLMAVDRVGLRGVRRPPMRACQSGLPSCRVERATKLPPASPPKSRPPAVVSRPPDPPPPLTPGYGWRHATLPVLESIAVRNDARRADACDSLAAQSHRAARIGVRQVEDVEAVVLADVEQAGVRRVRRRRPVRHATFDRRHERSGNGRFLAGIGIGLASSLSRPSPSSSPDRTSPSRPARRSRDRQ